MIIRKYFNNISRTKILKKKGMVFKNLEKTESYFKQNYQKDNIINSFLKNHNWEEINKNNKETYNILLKKIQKDEEFFLSINSKSLKIVEDLEEELPEHMEKFKENLKDLIEEDGVEKIGQFILFYKKQNNDNYLAIFITYSSKLEFYITNIELTYNINYLIKRNIDYEYEMLNIQPSPSSDKISPKLLNEFNILINDYFKNKEFYKFLENMSVHKKYLLQSNWIKNLKEFIY